jgi:DnaJ-class molecular chaperone
MAGWEEFMTTKQTCTICGGSGSVKQPSGKEIPCQNCAGTGILVTTNAPIEEERQWPKK